MTGPRARVSVGMWLLLLSSVANLRAEDGVLDLSYVRPRVPAPSEESIDRLKGKHPLVLVPNGGLAELQERGRTTHKKIAQQIAAEADRIIKEGVNAKPKNAESPMRRELRKPGQLAWAYAATGDAKYREAAIRWALACCAYPHWDIDVDLAAGHALVALAQVYDWFHDDLTAEQRKTIVEKVRVQGLLMDKCFGPEKVVGGTWWTKSFLQNHGTINCAGLYAAGAVFLADIPEAATWVKHAEAHFDKVFSVLDEDGSSMEGINYWAYGVENLMLYAELARSVTGRDYFSGCGYFRNAGRFLAAHLTPWLTQEDHAIPFAAPILGVGTHGASHILYKCAAIAKDSRAQQLGDLFMEKGINEGAYMFGYCLLWYDPTVPAAPTYADGATVFAFPELGIATARSSWKPDATVLWFKCGPYQGRAATEVMQRNVGSGHNHPDQTAIQLIGRGERLTAYGNTACANQSMILFRGQAQAGEPPDGKETDGVELIAVKEQPELLKVRAGSGVDYIAGDAGKIYRAAAGVERYRRHLIFVKPDDVIVADEIKLAATAGEKNAKAPDVEWFLQTMAMPKKVSERAFKVEVKKAALDVHLCLPEESFEMSAFDPPPNTGYAMPGIFVGRKQLRIRSTEPVGETLLVTHLHVRGMDDAPSAPAKARLEGRTLRVELGAHVVELDLEALNCRLK